MTRRPVYHLPRRLLGPILPWALCAAGCGAHPAPPPERPASPPDKPVPADEPRATLSLTVDLRPGPKCEEEFDLALYSNRAIDLIKWDARHGSCGARRIQVRYLARQIDDRGLLRKVEEIAQRTAVTPRTVTVGPSKER